MYGRFSSAGPAHFHLEALALLELAGARVEPAADAQAAQAVERVLAVGPQPRLRRAAGTHHGEGGVLALGKMVAAVAVAVQPQAHVAFNGGADDLLQVA